MDELLTVTEAGDKGDLISRLCALHQRFLRSRFDPSRRPVSVEVGMNDASTILDAALELERARHRINATDELVAALEPFARAEEDEDGVDVSHITLEDYRRARAGLSKHRGKG